MNEEQQLDQAMKKDFLEWVFKVVVENYKDGFLSKLRTRWALVKVWNSEEANTGIAGIFKEALGEKVATQVFQDESENFLSTPEGKELIKQKLHLQKPKK